MFALASRRRKEDEESEDILGELLREERGETELELTRYERAKIKKKLKTLEEPEEESFLSGITLEETTELIKTIPSGKMNEFLGLGAFVDGTRTLKPKERRKQVAQLLSVWPPPVPDTEKIYLEGMLKEGELAAKFASRRRDSETLAQPQDKSPKAQDNPSTVENEPTPKAMTMALSQFSGTVAAGGSVWTIMYVFGGAGPLHFSVRGYPEGTEAAIEPRQIPGPKSYVEEKAVLMIPPSARAGAYTLTFTARGADERTATATYALTVT